ncbi:unknown [Singapore grouper iridovirus]|uniref:Uncharacterized protein n=1 Tax=Singapore grouper iridovirus TaxID=262968 RepID=Q5YFG6_9VIRU|nr:hypothetical protein ORF099R [Singapore grouper iridovirus]AAS18114.1 unknown [Singapore grouper iridovirus]WAU86808.1 hypothetical protein ORF099R [Singapore grouper iridovirus]
MPVSDKDTEKDCVANKVKEDAADLETMDSSRSGKSPKAKTSETKRNDFPARSDLESAASLRDVLCFMKSAVDRFESLSNCER